MRWSSRAVATIALFLAAQSSGLAQEAGSSPEAADAKASQWDVAAPPLQALAAAATEPARHLGFDQDLGSLEPGKLADLVVLDVNPLENIYATDQVALVMQGGRLFEAATLNEMATGSAQRRPYFRERDGAAGGAAALRYASGHGDGDAN